MTPLLRWCVQQRGVPRLLRAIARYSRSLRLVPIRDEYGIVYVDLRLASSVAVILGTHRDPMEDACVRAWLRPGDVAYDIGAHWGTMTTLCSRLVGPTGHVCAWEPNPAVLPSLRATAARCRNVTLYPLALSNETGTRRLHVPSGDPSMASLRDWTQGRWGPIQTVAVPVVRLDDLCLPVTPRLIKCDVEGHELAVFQGATEMLSRQLAPVICWETNPEVNPQWLQTVFYLSGLAGPQYTVTVYQNHLAVALPAWARHA